MSGRWVFAVNAGPAGHMGGMKKKSAPITRPKCADMPGLTEIISNTNGGSGGLGGFFTQSSGRKTRKSSMCPERENPQNPQNPH